MINNVRVNIENKLSYLYFDDKEVIKNVDGNFMPIKSLFNKSLYNVISKLNPESKKLCDNIDDDISDILKKINTFIDNTNPDILSNRLLSNQKNDYIIANHIIRNNYIMHRKKIILDNSHLYFKPMNDELINYYFDKLSHIFKNFKNIVELFEDNTTLYNNKLFKDKSIIERMIRTHIIMSLLYISSLITRTDIEYKFTCSRNVLISMIAEGLCQLNFISEKNARLNKTLSPTQFISKLFVLLGIDVVKYGHITTGTTVYQIPVIRAIQFETAYKLFYAECEWLHHGISIFFTNVLFDCNIKSNELPLKVTNNITKMYIDLINPIINVIDYKKKNNTLVIDGAYLTQAHLDLYNHEFPNFKIMSNIDSLINETNDINYSIEKVAMNLLKGTINTHSKKHSLDNTFGLVYQPIKHRSFIVPYNERVSNKLSKALSDIDSYISSNGINDNIILLRSKLVNVMSSYNGNKLWCETVRSSSGRSTYVNGIDWNSVPKIVRNIVFDGYISVDISSTVFRSTLKLLNECIDVVHDDIKDKIKLSIAILEYYLKHKSLYRQLINRSVGLPDNSNFAKQITSIISMHIINMDKEINDIVNGKITNSAFNKLFYEYNIEDKILLLPAEISNLANATSIAVNFARDFKTMKFRSYVKLTNGKATYNTTYQLVDDNGITYAPNINSNLRLKDNYSSDKIFASIFCMNETNWIDDMAKLALANGIGTIGYVHDNIILNTTDIDLVKNIFDEDEYNIDVINGDFDISELVQNKRKKNVLINSRNSRFMRINQLKDSNIHDIQPIAANIEYNESKRIDLLHNIKINNRDFSNEELVSFINEGMNPKFIIDRLNITFKYNNSKYNHISSWTSYRLIKSNNTKNIKYITKLNIRWNIALQKAIYNNDYELHNYLTNGIILDIENNKYKLYNHQYTHRLNDLLAFINGECNYIDDENEWQPKCRYVTKELS